MNSVLLFGGSFNPIHNGHLIIGRYVAERSGIGKVVLIPGANPPHKQDQQLAAAGDRLAMCRLAVADDPQFAVDDWEIGQRGPNYTLHTIRHFREQLGADAQIHWLIGMDSLNELGTWYHASELVDACTIVSAARPGSARPDKASLAQWFSGPQIEKLCHHIVEGLRIDIGSTDIRARVRAGQSIRYLVPEPVRQYIREHGLYQET